MSRSQPTTQSNPAERFFEYSGDTGTFKYYDKETKETVQVPLPFSFLVLDQLSAIAGFSDADQSGFWSNEVRDVRTEPFHVRTKHGKKAEGLYADIKDEIKAEGAKYAKVLYIGYKNGNGLALGHLKLTGAANSAWIEFCKGRNVEQGAITVASTEEGKKGKTKFQIPVFETKEVSPETEAEAVELDKRLQEYLKGYFNEKAISANQGFDDTHVIEPSPFDDELPNEEEFAF